LNLRKILVRPVCPSEEQRYQELMQEHHYLGSLPKIGETIRYIAIWHDEWVALMSFSDLESTFASHHAFAFREAPSST